MFYALPKNKCFTDVLHLFVKTTKYRRFYKREDTLTRNTIYSKIKLFGYPYGPEQVV